MSLLPLVAQPSGMSAAADVAGNVPPKLGPRKRRGAVDDATGPAAAPGCETLSAKRPTDPATK